MFTGLRAIIGIIFLLMYLSLLFLYVVVFLGARDILTVLQYIPLFVILIDGGDRLFRLVFELRKSIRRIRYFASAGDTSKSKESTWISNINPYVLKRIMNTRIGEALSQPPVRYSDTLEKFDVKPYRIMISVYNLEEEWPVFWEYFKPWKNELFIVDDASTDETRNILTHHGIPVFSNRENRNKPSSILLWLPHLPEDIETVLVTDPDVELPDRFDLERSIFDFQRSGAAACALKILPTWVEDNYLEKCQYIEYDDAMSFGKSVPHNNIFISGGAAIFNRKALEKHLKLGTQSIYAEDYEISLLFNLAKLRTYYDERTLVKTRVPTTLMGLTRQRMAWYFGLAKVTFPFALKAYSIRNFFFLYEFYVYNLGIEILIHPWRVIATFVFLISFVAMIGGIFFPVLYQYQLISSYYVIFIWFFYILMTFGSYIWSDELKRHDFPVVFLYYPYDIFVDVLPTTVGYINYLCWLLTKKKLVSDHYDKASEAIF